MSGRHQPYFLAVTLVICIIGVIVFGGCAAPPSQTPTFTPAPTPTSQPTPTPTTTTPAPATPLTATSLPSGKVGVNYSGTLAAGGGTPPYTWSLLSGNLPAGLSLNPSGAIAGIPGKAGTFNFTAQVKDSGNPAMTSQGVLSIVVSPPDLVITVNSLPAGRAGTPYGTLVTATGGTAPYAWSIASGKLPSGVNLSTDGTIVGVPDTPGTVTFTVQVKDSSVPPLTVQAPLSIVLAAPPISIANTTLPLGSAGSIYSAALYTNGGTAPFTWSVVSGSLPPGLTLSSAGVVGGIPNGIGTFNFTVQVTDSSSSPLSAQAVITLTITYATTTPLSIVTPYLPIGKVGTAYSTTLVATGGTAPYIWIIYSGSVPPGLSLTSNGVLSGVPGSSGTYNFVIRVSDSSVPANTVERTFVLVI